jgi:signal transduction histidine kinase
VKAASGIHAVGRVRSGFDLQAIVAEYRALRASVIRLWRETHPVSQQRDVEDLTRFNESIDQSLAEATRNYSLLVDRSRQMFLAILGHDLRNPLNSMLMSAQALSQTTEPDAASAKMATQISSSATAMARMISDLLDFTAAGLGGVMPLKPAAMDLKRLCQEVVDELHAASPKHLLRFQPHGDLTGEWDSSRLRQMISNLVGNAIQHGIETGPVDFTASAEGREVMLTVRNGGPPIPPDALPTIFDPLTRGSSAELEKQRRPGSIGLGLYIAREVITAHGGTIEVRSSVDAGTVFTVRLPRKHAMR